MRPANAHYTIHCLYSRGGTSYFLDPAVLICSRAAHTHINAHPNRQQCAHIKHCIRLLCRADVWTQTHTHNNTQHTWSQASTWELRTHTNKHTHMSVSGVVIAGKGQTDCVRSGCYSDLSKHQSHCSPPPPSWFDLPALLV